MKKSLFEIFRVKIAWNWMKNTSALNKGYTYTFSSLYGCKIWIEEQMKKGLADDKQKVLWYSIEGIEYFLYDDAEPYGQIYEEIIFQDNHYEE